MTTTTSVTPRIDSAPAHSCGTLYRAGVITAGCSGCRANDRRAERATAR